MDIRRMISKGMTREQMIAEMDKEILAVTDEMYEARVKYVDAWIDYMVSIGALDADLIEEDGAWDAIYEGILKAEECVPTLELGDLPF